jgi:uncharacterized protein (DUF1684 family)
MDALSLLDWRRRVAQLYAEIRRAPDPGAAHQHWRLTRDDLLMNHPQSPVPPARRARFPGVPVAPYDPAYRFEVEVTTAVEPHRLEVATGTDGIVTFDRAGAVDLPGLGTLDVWWLVGYGGGLFVPLRDGLAGRRTYGGGRYVIDTVKGADLGGTAGGIVLDLNFAYNPSCAYDPAWACPLAPPGNVIAGPVPVGEFVDERDR